MIDLLWKDENHNIKGMNEGVAQKINKNMSFFGSWFVP